MGRVYEAVDAAGQPVAVKVLNQQWSKNPESMERFKQEGHSRVLSIIHDVFLYGQLMKSTASHSSLWN